jgi:hypothetical protein
MFERFAKALKIAVHEEGFVQILGAALLLIIVGTLTYTTSQDWSLVDGFYFAVATLTTSSIADPHLVLTREPIKIFTVFCILVGIGILVELVRQIGFAYVEVRRGEKAAKDAKADKDHAAALETIIHPVCDSCCELSFWLDDAGTAPRRCANTAAEPHSPLIRGRRLPSSTPPPVARVSK